MFPPLPVHRQPQGPRVHPDGWPENRCRPGPCRPVTLGANEAAVEYVTWNVHWVVDRFTEGEWVTTSGHYFKADYATAHADFLARAA